MSAHRTIYQVILINIINFKLVFVNFKVEMNVKMTPEYICTDLNA